MKPDAVAPRPSCRRIEVQPRRRRSRRALGVRSVFAALALALQGASAAQSPDPSGVEVPASARGRAIEIDGEAQLEARLLAAPEAQQGGRRRVGVLFELAPGWHIYAKDPGQSGVATALHFEAPGARVSELGWPQPQVFRESDGLFTTYGYAGRVLLGAELAPESPGAALSQLELRAEFLACREECVPGSLQLSRDLRVAQGAAEAATSRELLAALPAAEADPVLASEPPATPPKESPATADGQGTALWLRALLLAFLGGIVLNGMPCVLPVLVMKIFALSELAQSGRREAIRHGIAYTAGVVGSMLLLAAAVLVLRGAGMAVGWGFQFQEPLFVAAVAALVVAFALNLFGVFEIAPDTGRLAEFGAAASGWRRSLFDGLLAVVLATPCTAPFLGTAVGLAFASSAPLAAAIFAAIGLGLAAPFALVSALPGLAGFVPRPGAWMLHLRTMLGFSLLATSVWLVWVLGRNAGVDAAAALLALLVGFAFLIWAYGALQRAGHRAAGLSAASAAAVLLLVGLDWVDVAPAEEPGSGPPASIAASQAGWRPWAPEAIGPQLAAGQRVFVAFSADWCITCKLNERRVLQNPEVEAAFERAGVLRMHADWTRRDARIGEELLRHGRAGVPLYLLYEPGAPDAPRVLPELLGAKELLALLAAGA